MQNRSVETKQTIPYYVYASQIQQSSSASSLYTFTGGIYSVSLKSERLVLVCVALVGIRTPHLPAERCCDSTAILVTSHSLPEKSFTGVFSVGYLKCAWI